MWFWALSTSTTTQRYLFEITCHSWPNARNGRALLKFQWPLWKFYWWISSFFSLETIKKEKSCCLHPVWDMWKTLTRCFSVNSVVVGGYSIVSRKLPRKRERENLEEGLADVSFTRGAPLQDLQLPGRLANVYVRDISCEEPIERLYYTAKYPLICVYCANPLDTNSNYPDSDGCFPQCGGCKDRPNIKVMYFMSVDIGIRQKIRSHYMYDVAWWASCVATVGPRGGLFSNLMWHVAW